MKPKTLWIMRFVLVATVILSGMWSASAQTRTTDTIVTSDVYIVQPIAIYKLTDMQFGAIVSGASGGLVTLSTSGSRTKTGTIILPSSFAGRAASFVVLGTPNQTYSLSLPSSMTLVRQSGSETMTVSSFVSNPSSFAFNSGGSSNVSVGATLTVGGNQVLGLYTGSFSVTVSYQ